MDQWQTEIWTNVIGNWTVMSLSQPRFERTTVNQNSQALQNRHSGSHGCRNGHVKKVSDLDLTLSAKNVTISFVWLIWTFFISSDIPRMHRCLSSTAEETTWQRLQQLLRRRMVLLCDGLLQQEINQWGTYIYMYTCVQWNVTNILC